MIVGIGVDIVEIGRIEKALGEADNRFRDRVFTSSEIDYCERRGSRFASYAARFAAKEATMKALGTGWADGIGWREIGVGVTDSGAPFIELSGRALERFQELGAASAYLSLSHSGQMAIACVVLES